VKTEHGILPVPAPATARCSPASPVYARGPEVELTTPTGAAVAVTLAEAFRRAAAMKIARTGYGAGGPRFPQHANVLRVILGEPPAPSEATTVSVIEANIDDLNPQVLAYAMERLLELRRARRDAAAHRHEEGPPGHLLRVIAKPEDREALAQIVFAETSTLGLRIYTAERRVQARTLRGSGDAARQGAHEGFRRRRLRARI
jgi:pyridinium-3,5-bisthiocarboxylic acid mononucleotide nickel chelatase